jgi:hypothetical protein
MKLVLSLIAVITICSFNKTDQVNEFSFLEGTWKVENKENYETWKLKNENELEGNSYRIRAEKKTISEYLTIKKIDDQVVYTAKVWNQNNGKTIEFVWNKEVKNKLSFENLSHDFPKKIQYTKLDTSTLWVEVLGEGDKGFSYKMMKQ